MRTRIGLGAAVLAALLGLAGPVSADLGGDLANLRAAADLLLAGGTLDAGQTRAVNGILAAVGKAEAVADDLPKRIKKVAGVVKKVEKAVKKGVDLSTHAATLSATVDEEVLSLREQADQAGRPLQVDGDRAKIEKLMAKGDAAVTRAAAAATYGKHVKKAARAAKTFVKAKAKADQLFQRELDKGLLRLEVVSTSLDEIGAIPPGEPIFVFFNLPVDAAVLLPGVVLITGGPTGGPYPLRLDGAPGGTGLELIIFSDPPLEPGTYSLVLLGQDSAGGKFVASTQGVPLAETFTLPFEIR